MKTVLVGCGGIADHWLTCLKAMPEVEVAGLVDIRAEAAKAKAEKYGLAAARIGADLAEILRAVRPEALFNCTIPAAHTATTLLGLEAGCHVLTEKPLADTLENARALAAASRRTGKLLAVMQNRRYNRHILALKRFLESGAIGKITTVTSHYFMPQFRKHFLTMPHVLLLDMAIHTFDAARFLMGADAADVFALEWNPPGSWFERDASAVVIFRMTDGSVFTYQGSWCAEGLSTPYESVWRIIGDAGTAIWDGAEGLRAQSVKPVWVNNGWRRDIVDAVIPADAPPGQEEGHAAVIREFVRCVREGGRPQTDCVDNLRSLAMVFGAIRSAEQGARVSVGGEGNPTP